MAKDDQDGPDFGKMVQMLIEYWAETRAKERDREIFNMLAFNHPKPDEEIKKATPEVHIDGLKADRFWLDELPNEFNCRPIPDEHGIGTVKYNFDDHAYDQISYALMKDELIASTKIPNKLIWKTLMENSENKEQIHLSIEAKDGVAEIIHRYGSAKEIKEPKSLDISGSIEAPGEYFERRHDIIDMDKAHLEVWQDKGKIKLDCDPQAPDGNVTVTGKMHVNPLLAAMDINKFGQSKRGEDDFVLMLKESRRLFTDPKVCMNLVDKISNIDYQVGLEIEKNDDERGSKKNYFEQHCNAELPESFDLTTNIFVASKDEIQEHTFQVELKFHYSGQLYFWLESFQLQEIKDEVMEEMLGDEILKFDGKIPVIYK